MMLAFDSHATNKVTTRLLTSTTEAGTKDLAFSDVSASVSMDHANVWSREAEL